MTERQKKLVKDYGPKFVAESHIIKDRILYLSGDAASVLTDAEWLKCAEAMTKFVEELNKVEDIVTKRVEETLNEGEDFVDLYAKAQENIKRFMH